MKRIYLLIIAFFALQVSFQKLNAQQFPIVSRYDVIISEIMAKPTPQTNLPPVEYVELHNRLHEACCLKNFTLKIGNTSKKLPEIVIDSCGYAVIVAEKYVEMMSFCDNLYSVSSLSIADAGQSITLLNGDSEVIHHVKFKQSWHSEPIKQDGGWSLEMIDTQNPCAGKENWTSSIDNAGGTPGKTNSVNDEVADFQLPYLVSGTMSDSVTLVLHLSKSVFLNETETVVKITPNVDVLSVSEVPPDFNSLEIKLLNPLERGILYNISLQGNIVDCKQNYIDGNIEVRFGVAEEAERGDLLINEILTNSIENDADYLELYNNSQKIIDLKNVKIGYGGDTIPQKAVSAVSRGRQMLPESYVVLCKNKDATKNRYYCKDENSVVECDSLPNFAISSGIVHITDKSFHSIDRLCYDESMHYQKLLTTKGVALERIHFEKPTQDVNNWRSAAETSNFGTPGYENSQARNESVELQWQLEIVPEVFSPDNDGFEDFAEIYCEFENEENRVSIVVFDNKGHPVKRVVNNALCGKSERFVWDGLDDKNNHLPAGMYMVQLEYWNVDTRKSGRKRKVVSIYR